jgi:hypothetical protein
VIAMSRVLVAFIVGALCGAIAVPAAVGKEGVRARLDSPLPLAAAPGTTVTVVWTLGHSEHGDRRPFDAGGLFVRLLSASGNKPTSAFGVGSTGRYVARVRIPSGGIGGIEFGLVGYIDIGPGPMGKEADVYFPLDNNPLPLHARAGLGSTTRARPTDADSAAPIWIVAVGLMCAAGLSLGVRRLVTLRRGYRSAARQLRDP